MNIVQINKIKPVLELHRQITGREFPIESYYKKKLMYDVNIYVYEQDEKYIGYSLVVDKANDKDLYAWYGGVLPQYQGQGITSSFLDKLISLAIEGGYNSVTLATSNVRPHMLRLAIKKGFDIVDLKKRDYGDGNKIYLSYKIQTPTEDLINLSKIFLRDMESFIVRCYKSNCTILTVECTNIQEDLNKLQYLIIYYNSLARLPYLEVKVLNSDNADECERLMKMYKGVYAIKAIDKEGVLK